MDYALPCVDSCAGCKDGLGRVEQRPDDRDTEMGEVPRRGRRMAFDFGRREATTEADAAALLREGGPKLLAGRLEELVQWAEQGPRRQAVLEAASQAHTMSQEAAMSLVATALADDGKVILGGLDLSGPHGLAQVESHPRLLETLFPGDALAAFGRLIDEPGLEVLAKRWRELLEETLAALPEHIAQERNDITRAALLFTWRLALEPSLQNALRTEFLTVGERHPHLMEIPWVADLANRSTSTPTRAIALIAAVESSGEKLLQEHLELLTPQAESPEALLARRWLSTLITLGVGLTFTMLWALWGRMLYETLPGLNPGWWWLYPASQLTSAVIVTALVGFFSAHPRFNSGAANSLQALALCSGLLATGDLGLGALLVSAADQPQLFYSFLGATVPPALGCLLMLAYGITVTAAPADSAAESVPRARKLAMLWFTIALPGLALGIGHAVLLLRMQQAIPHWPPVILTAGTAYAWWVLPAFTMYWLVLGHPKFHFPIPVFLSMAGLVAGLLYPILTGEQTLLPWTGTWLCPQGHSCSTWDLLKTALLPPWWPVTVLGLLYVISVAAQRREQARR